MLKYKEDADKAIERFKAFWEHEIIDRVCLFILTEAPDIETAQALLKRVCLV